jgi:hypothetical protein
MAQSHKRLNKRPNFRNGVKWAAIQQNNLNIIERLNNEGK